MLHLLLRVAMRRGLWMVLRIRLGWVGLLSILRRGRMMTIVGVLWGGMG